MRSAVTFQRVLPSMLKGSGVVVRAQRRFLRPPDPLPPAIRRRLVDYFRDDIARAGELIGRDLSRWLEP